jgi:HisJ family histidinol phosphate phosphatase
MMTFPKINLHIHSIYSDGKNSIRDVVDKALNLGLNYICITDHFTNSWKANVIPSLNTKAKIEKYLTELSDLQQELIDYGGKLILLKGIEIDISSSYDYITKLIVPENFDIILFEYLENVEGIGFVKNILLNWEQRYSKNYEQCLFGLAHLDPSYFEYSSLGTLISFLKKYEIYFEFNSSYPEFYSQRYKFFFKELKANNILVSIGCDSHDLSTLANFHEPLQRIQNYDLELNFARFIKKLEKKEIISHSFD